MSWFRIVNVAEQKSRLDIYSSIGESVNWWGEKVGLAASDFSAALRALGNPLEIELHIKSPGGSVVDGWAIYGELRRHSARINVVIDGQAASMASVIAMAGDHITMGPGATFWVHNPMAFFDSVAWGESSDLREIAKAVLRLADDLDLTGEALIDAYVSRPGSKVDRATMKALMDDQTTITAERALELGLCDEIEQAWPMVARRFASRVDMRRVAAQQQERLQNIFGGVFAARGLTFAPARTKVALGRKKITRYRGR